MMYLPVSSKRLGRLQYMAAFLFGAAMHKTDMIINELMCLLRQSMSERNAIQFRKSLIHLAMTARAEDQVPLRVIAEAHIAIQKAQRTT